MLSAISHFDVHYGIECSSCKMKPIKGKIFPSFNNSQILCETCASAFIVNMTNKKPEV